MSDQAIIGLVVSLGAGIAALVYYLMGSIKATVDESNESILGKLEKLFDSLGKVSETVAVKAAELEYLGREIDSIKKNCWKCNQLRAGIQS